MFVVSGAIFKTGLIEGLSTRIIQVAKIHFLVALVCFAWYRLFFPWMG
jgi:hypothetical protein